MTTTPVPVTITIVTPETPATFVSWLRGFLDASPGGLTHAQVEQIRKKLEGVQTAQPFTIAPYTQPYIPPIQTTPWVGWPYVSEIT